MVRSSVCATSRKTNLRTWKSAEDPSTLCVLSFRCLAVFMCTQLCAQTECLFQIPAEHVPCLPTLALSNQPCVAVHKFLQTVSLMRRKGPEIFTFLPGGRPSTGWWLWTGAFFGTTLPENCGRCWPKPSTCVRIWRRSTTHTYTGWHLFGRWLHQRRRRGYRFAKETRKRWKFVRSDGCMPLAAQELQRPLQK